MALNDQPATIAYATDGISVQFSVPFYYSQPSDLVVTYRDSNGVVTTKSATADYSVSGTVDQKLGTYNMGGSVTFNVPLPASGRVRITRKTPRNQTAVYLPDDPFRAGAHEGALDRAMLILQEMFQAIGCVGVADGPPTDGTYEQRQWYANANAGPGDTFGWFCGVGGSPGTWYEMFTISQLQA